MVEQTLPHYQEWFSIDRQGWPPGEWDSEPDKAQWVDPATGLDCLAVRHPMFGHWCGYVGLPPDHVYFEVSASKVRARAHGGLNFEGFCNPSDDPARGVCHVPAPGRPERIWWLGFDCFHGGDVAPGMQGFISRTALPDFPTLGGYVRYRSLAYVKVECAKLARQLANP